MQRTCAALLVLLPACVPACVSVSAEPLYPAAWPPRTLQLGDAPATDLCGTYHAVSDPAPALEYPRGGRPQESFFCVPMGPPVPLPPLGRRVLAWHLAGSAGPADGDLWRGLERFAAALGADDDHPDGRDDLGWVRVERVEGDRYDVQCGVDGETLASFELAPSPSQGLFARLWTVPPGYVVDAGALVVHSVFPAGLVERSPGAHGLAGGSFTFWRSADGSLVMLESPHYAPPGGEVSLRKWWRWRPVQPG